MIIPEIVSHVTVRADSLEIGTPSRGGSLKIFFDAGDPIESERRIREGFRLKEIARTLAGGAAA
jgi:hypothetical protein